MTISLSARALPGYAPRLNLAESGSVLVVAKDSLRESSSEYAQGGIAAALSDDDEVELHEQDTMVAGAGLCDREAVRILVQEGPGAIQKLIDWGVEFDREGSEAAVRSRRSAQPQPCTALARRFDGP